MFFMKAHKVVYITRPPVIEGHCSVIRFYLSDIWYSITGAPTVQHSSYHVKGKRKRSARRRACAEMGGCMHMRAGAVRWSERHSGGVGSDAPGTAPGHPRPHAAGAGIAHPRLLAAPTRSAPQLC